MLPWESVFRNNYFLQQDDRAAKRGTAFMKEERNLYLIKAGKTINLMGFYRVAYV